MNVALLRANFKVQKIDTKAELMVANPFHITKNQGHLQPLSTKTKVKSKLSAPKQKQLTKSENIKYKLFP